MIASQIAKSRRQLLAAVSALGVALGMGGGPVSADQAQAKSKQSSATSQKSGIKGEHTDATFYHWD